VLRELGRLVRDLLVISIDPSRLSDPEIAAEGEEDQLKEVASLFSHEDLMRAFDVLTKGEEEIRSSMQPRFHLEMTLLRWIHLRKLVPLSDLIDGLDRGTTGGGRSAGPSRSPAPQSRPGTSAPASGAGGSSARPAPAAPATSPAPRPAEVRRPAPPAKASAGKPVETSAGLPAVEPVPAERFKDAFLEEIRKAKKFFYGTVIAQAQKIHVEGDRVVITFAPQHRALRSQLEQTRPHLETIAGQLAGRKMSVVPAEGTMLADPAARGDAGSQSAVAADGKKAALREQAMADSGVQAMLDVFAAEIKDVEEM